MPPVVRPTTVENFLKEETGLRVGADASERMTALLTTVATHIAAGAAAAAAADERGTILERDVAQAFEQFLQGEDAVVFSPATLHSAIGNIDNDHLTQLISLLREDLQA
jgi:histone H3/H4